MKELSELCLASTLTNLNHFETWVWCFYTLPLYILIYWEPDFSFFWSEPVQLFPPHLVCSIKLRLAAGGSSIFNLQTSSHLTQMSVQMLMCPFKSNSLLRLRLSNMQLQYSSAAWSHWAMSASQPIMRVNYGFNSPLMQPGFQNESALLFKITNKPCNCCWGLSIDHFSQLTQGKTGLVALHIKAAAIGKDWQCSTWIL